VSNIQYRYTYVTVRSTDNIEVHETSIKQFIVRSREKRFSYRPRKLEKK